MSYYDRWLKPHWLKIFTCRVAGFTEETGRRFIDAGVPHAIILARYTTYSKSAN
jgi:hypothetical protein